MNRGSSFEKEGRIHSEQQSKALDAEVKQILKDYNIYYGSYCHNTISVAIRNCITHLCNFQRRATSATRPSVRAKIDKIKEEAQNGGKRIEAPVRTGGDAR